MYNRVYHTGIMHDMSGHLAIQIRACSTSLLKSTMRHDLEQHASLPGLMKQMQADFQGLVQALLQECITHSRTSASGGLNLMLASIVGPRSLFYPQATSCNRVLLCQVCRSFHNGFESQCICKAVPA